MVGTSTATCLPSCTALNAARIATSVLPNPTSPHTRRSIGWSSSMSAFTSAMATQLVGRLLVREGVFELVLPRRVDRELVAGRAQAGLVEHDQLLGDLGDRRAHLGPGLLPAVAAQLVEHRRLAAGVVADEVDLVGRHVELVVALVLEEQVVPLHPADGPLHHPAVAGHAVLVVHHVVALLQVLEEAERVALADPGRAVGPATTGEVVLGQHGQLHRREDAAALERGHLDLGADAAGRQQLAGPFRPTRRWPRPPRSGSRRPAARPAGGRRARDRRPRRPGPSR